VASGGMTYVRCFMIGSDILVTRVLRLLPQQLCRPQCSCCWWEKFMKSAVEMAWGGLMCIPSFMTIGSSIQEILRALPKNLRGCSIGITHERDLLHSHWDGLRWHDIHTEFQLILSFLLQQFERLLFWCYRWEEFMIYMPLRWAEVPWCTYQV
jgi:hypothetical protein